MKKIIIIGCPGSGKSTFSRCLRDKTGLPLYHLDMIWHKPDKTNVTREEFDKQHTKLLEGESWIIDGHYCRTLSERFEKCDTVFFFDIPVEECISGIESRVGKKREDIPWVEEEFDDEFRQFVLDFPKIKLPAVFELIEKHKDKNIITFKSRKEAEDYLLSL